MHAPIRDAVVGQVSERERVDREVVEDVLDRVDDHFTTGADDILDHYEDADHGEVLDKGETSIVLRIPYADEWDVTAEQVGLTDGEKQIARIAYEEEARRRVGGDGETFGTMDALIVPVRRTGEYVDAGLSPQESRVQVRRELDRTQVEIAEEFGVSAGTVARQASRIDAKTREARRLVSLRGDA